MDKGKTLLIGHFNSTSQSNKQRTFLQLAQKSVFLRQQQQNEDAVFRGVNSLMKTIMHIMPAAAIALVTVSAMPAQAQQTGDAANSAATQAQAEQLIAGEPITIAQGRERYPEISATAKYSYVGIGANIGLSDDDQSVADGGVAVISKIAVTKNVSVRPGISFGDDTVITVPITYDFPLRGRDPFVENPVTPYIGGGVVFDTGSEEDADFLVTGGADYRFAKNWVGNVGVNVGFGDDNPDIGVVFGVGYAIPHSR